MKKITALILTVCLILGCCTAFAAENDTATVGLALDTASPTIGNTVTLVVTAEQVAAQKFYAADVAIAYNPTVLKANHDAEMGSELASSGIMTKIYSQTDEKKGIVRFAVGMDPEEYLEEGFVLSSNRIELFRITFEVIGEGDANLQVASSDTSPIYADTFPKGVKMFLGSATELATLTWEPVNCKVGKKGALLISRILPIEKIVLPYGTEQPPLPQTVEVKLSDNSTAQIPITWTGFMSTYTPDVPGLYLFRGALQPKSGQENNQGLFPLVEVEILNQDGTSSLPAEEEIDDPTGQGGNTENIDNPTGTGGSTENTDDPTGKGGSTENTDNPTATGGATEKTDDPTGTGGSTENTDDPTGKGGSNEIFEDLGDVAWAVEPINELAKAGVLSGTSQTTFSPNQSVTRAEFVAMLTRAFGLLDEQAVSDFTDVAEGEWYYSAVASAKAAGITAGYEDGTFAPNAQITREEMAAMAYRTAQIAALDLAPTKEAEQFSDRADIAEYALSAIEAMQCAGVINGMGDGTFAPQQTADRAQAAVIIYRLYLLQ